MPQDWTDPAYLANTDGTEHRHEKAMRNAPGLLAVSKDSFYPVLVYAYLLSRVGCEQAVACQSADLLERPVNWLLESRCIATIIDGVVRGYDDSLALTPRKVKLIDLAIDLSKALE